MKNKLPGLLLRSIPSTFGDKVFYVDKGKRHWVRDGAWLDRNGFNWSSDINDVSADFI